MVVSQVGAVAGIDRLATQALEARLHGDVIHPDDPQYEAARRTHNLRVDRQPGLIVRAADAGDVVRAVEFARARDLPLAIRSGGHGTAGHGTLDGGVVVDLSMMKNVSVDPERRTAWAQPGATSADLVAATAPYGLALSTGDTASVGLGGLTTGGGIGWMVRKQGLTIDNLLAAEVVTADGRIVVASAEQHPDLFWALRGGSGNFGIVTGFEYRLHEVPMVLGGALLLPPTLEALRGWAEYAPYAPEELTTICFLMHIPPVEPFPPALHGQLVFLVGICYAGDVEAGQRAIDPLRKVAEPLGELIGPMPYAGMFTLAAMGEPAAPTMLRSGFMDALTDEAITTLLDHLKTHPAPMGMVQLRGLGGAVARVEAGATAFGHRDKPLMVAILNLGGSDEDVVWTETLWQGLRRSISGVYVNFLDQGEERVAEAYPAGTYARLAAVKHHYDPTNFFRNNQNIRPAR